LDIKKYTGDSLGGNIVVVSEFLEGFKKAIEIAKIGDEIDSI